MRPPAGHDHFDPRNVRIHGIEEHMVAHEPRFADLFDQIGGFIGSDPLVAHNAAFDMGVIRSALEVSELAGPAYEYACTVILSRRSYSLVSHSLPFAAEAAGVPLINHHDAVEDARACAGIMIDVAARNEASSLHGLYATLGLQLPASEAYIPGVVPLSKHTRTAAERLANGTALNGWVSWPTEGDNPPPNPDAESTHPLFGQTVVFTGNLGMSRPEAKQRAAELGAQPASRVTRGTTVLVVGDGFVADDLVSGRVTAKAGRVMELHQRGQQIEVLSEAEFLQMTGGRWPAAAV